MKLYTDLARIAFKLISKWQSSAQRQDVFVLISSWTLWVDYLWVINS